MSLSRKSAPRELSAGKLEFCRRVTPGPQSRPREVTSTQKESLAHCEKSNPLQRQSVRSNMYIEALCSERALTSHAKLQIGNGLVVDIKSGTEAINEVSVILLFCAHFHIFTALVIKPGT